MLCSHIYGFGPCAGSNPTPYSPSRLAKPYCPVALPAKVNPHRASGRRPSSCSAERSLSSEMVSKRQKLARKRFKEANPELFPKPEPSKKKEGKKTKKARARPRGGTTRGKHPLRVPGMQPGESCFICKSPEHVAKNCPEKAGWEKNKICLLCRKRGHSLKHCPEKSDIVERKFCYNCGEAGHSLSKCPQPLEDGGTKFASCFICNEQGHLSKNCPKNKHGIYIKGGSCKICGGVTHLAKDCPNKGNRDSVFPNGVETAYKAHEESCRGHITFFQSGDDLEDDFSNIEDSKSGKKEATTVIATSLVVTPSMEDVGNTNHVKPKKKQGPKIVNFVG